MKLLTEKMYLPSFCMYIIKITDRKNSHYKIHASNTSVSNTFVRKIKVKHFILNISK